MNPFYTILFLITFIQCQFPSLTNIQNRLTNGTYDRLARPNAGGPPTIIKAQYRVNRLSDINPIKNGFEMDLFLRLQWVDTRLTFPESVDPDSLRVDPKLIWLPDMYFYNEQTKMDVLDYTLKISNDGTVFWSRHYIMSFTTPFDLRNFPFDSQNLLIKLVSYSFNQDILKLQFFDEGEAYPPINKTFSSVLWELSAVTSKTDTIIFRDNTTPFDLLTLSLTVDRISSIYILKYIAPLYFIGLCSSIGYWIEVLSLPTRGGFGVSLLLATITLNFVVSSELPRVNYASLLDSYIGCIFGFVFLSLMEYSMVHYIATAYKNRELTQQIDKTFRYQPIPLTIITINLFFIDKNSWIFVFFWILTPLMVLGILIISTIHYIFYVLPRKEDESEYLQPDLEKDVDDGADAGMVAVCD